MVDHSARLGKLVQVLPVWAALGEYRRSPPVEVRGKLARKVKPAAKCTDLGRKTPGRVHQAQSAGRARLALGCTVHHI